jgi:hypothetical protein
LFQFFTAISTVGGALSLFLGICGVTLLELGEVLLMASSSLIKRKKAEQITPDKNKTNGGGICGVK